MATKYIVDNLTGQTITGDVTINGNLSVTGVTTGNLATYKALLTDVGPQTGTTLNDFNDGFIIGETYTITTYVSGDSFSNIANVTSGVIDTTGCVFIATGETPTNWNNGSTLVSSGNLVVTVLGNNLGYDIEWIEDEFQPGFYLGFNSTTGPLYNTFNRNSTFIQSGNVIPFFGPTLINTFILTYNYIEKDDSIVLAVFDLDGGPTPVSDSLYYFPVEIQIPQDTDTTPVDIYGEILPSFPFVDNLVGVGLYCDGNLLQNFSCDPSYGINNISDLLILLNSEYPNILGVYSEGGPGGIKLTMSTNFKNQFCSNGILTFEVYSFSV